MKAGEVISGNFKSKQTILVRVDFPDQSDGGFMKEFDSVAEMNKALLDLKSKVPSEFGKAKITAVVGESRNVIIGPDGNFKLSKAGCDC